MCPRTPILKEFFCPKFGGNNLNGFYQSYLHINIVVQHSELICIILQIYLFFYVYIDKGRSSTDTDQLKGGSTEKEDPCIDLM